MAQDMTLDTTIDALSESTDKIIREIRLLRELNRDLVSALDRAVPQMLALYADNEQDPQMRRLAEAIHFAGAALSKAREAARR